MLAGDRRPVGWPVNEAGYSVDRLSAGRCRRAASSAMITVATIRATQTLNSHESSWSSRADTGAWSAVSTKPSQAQRR